MKMLQDQHHYLWFNSKQINSAIQCHDFVMQMYFLECDKNVMEMCLLCTFFLAPPGKLCLARQCLVDAASLTSPIRRRVPFGHIHGASGKLDRSSPLARGPILWGRRSSRSGGRTGWRPWCIRHLTTCDRAFSAPARKLWKKRLENGTLRFHPEMQLISPADCTLAVLALITQLPPRIQS